MTGMQRKSRRGLKVRNPGGRWRDPMMHGRRAGNVSAGAHRGEEETPADHLPPPWRRRNGRQGTAVREEVGQPRGMEKGGASFGSLRRSFKKIAVVPRDAPRKRCQPNRPQLSEGWRRAPLPSGHRCLSNPHERSELRLRHTKNLGSDMFDCFHSWRIICAIGFLASANYPFAHFSLSANGYRMRT